MSSCHWLKIADFEYRASSCGSVSPIATINYSFTTRRLTLPLSKGNRIGIYVVYGPHRHRHIVQGQHILSSLTSFNISTAQHTLKVVIENSTDIYHAYRNHNDGFPGVTFSTILSGSSFDAAVSPPALTISISLTLLNWDWMYLTCCVRISSWSNGT